MAGPRKAKHARRRRAVLDEGGRALLAQLAQLYRELETRYEAYGCQATTECCRFGITGRQPYVTSIELLAVQRAIASLGGMPSERRRALPLADDEATCPLLGRDKRCLIYAARPFGCRTFWCERASSMRRVPQRELNGLVERLRQLAQAHQPEGHRGRPLTRALELTKTGRRGAG